VVEDASTGTTSSHIDTSIIEIICFLTKLPGKLRTSVEIPALMKSILGDHGATPWIQQCVGKNVTFKDAPVKIQSKSCYFLIDR
jgi:hypothetical protein